MTPKRVQMTRQRPWRAEHPDAVIVARPSRWGNPFYVDYPIALDDAVRMYRELIVDREAWITTDTGTRWEQRNRWRATGKTPTVEDVRSSLAGRDLACWCALDQPCHADVLLDLANGGAR